jgi:LmbE family N-acetylglucosaminyl deacetylase
MLCLGAHPDEIEIGAGAMLLSMLERGISLDAHWCVLNGVGERRREATASAADFLSGAESAKIEVMSFDDGFLTRSSHGSRVLKAASIRT